MPENPSGYSSNKKVEPEFFNDTHMPWRSDENTASNYSKGLSWYAEFFNHCDESTIKGESSPIYFHAPEVPERIHKHFPKVKLIALLRNPADRLFSLYTYTKLNNVGRTRVPSTFSEFIRLPEVLELSLHHKHLMRYLEYFPREQIKVLIYEEIAMGPDGFMKSIYEFLGIDASHKSEFTGVRVNSAESRMKDELRRAYRNKYGKYIGKAVSLIRGLFLNSIKQKKEVIMNADRDYLSQYYQADTKALEKFLGRELQFWNAGGQ
jgi:hypothetical protein